MQKRINTFSRFCKQRFGNAIYKISLDLGEKCPNREMGGCIFCSAPSYSPGYLESQDSIAQQIGKGKKRLPKHARSQYFAYFQQETPTAYPLQKLVGCMHAVLNDTSCVGVILSSRPDYIHQPLVEEMVTLVEKYKKFFLIELGVQSVHSKSLKLLNRNHSYDDFLDARLKIASCQGVELGVHLIFGIPGETDGDMIETVRSVCETGVQHLKIHHLQVLRNTDLYQLYNAGHYSPFSLTDYIFLLTEVLQYIPYNIVIHRLWASSHPQLLVAPQWNILPTQLRKHLDDLLEERDVWQGKMVDQYFLP